MIDELWLNRTVEDFDETRVSRERIDSYRKWHHTRTNVGTPVSMEQMQEDCEDGTKDIADPNGEFEHEVLNELRLKSFMETLLERDREILKLKMQGMTDQKIAEKVGFKNHSAVVKRRKQIAEHFPKICGKRVTSILFFPKPLSGRQWFFFYPKRRNFLNE